MKYVRVHWDVWICAYIHDILILHQDSAYLTLATLQIAVYFQSLGWTLALEKCEFTPAHEIVHLGWRWQFLELTLRMTSAMRATLLFVLDQWAPGVVKQEQVSCRALGSLIGSLNFLRGQLPRASVYLRTLHSVSTATLSELLLWRRNVWYNTPYCLRPRVVKAMLTIDVCKHGWCALLEIGGQSFVTYGSYWTEDALTSSNQRETTAVLRALLAFRSRLEALRGHSLAVRMDNMVTVFNLRRQGASGGMLLKATRAKFSLLTAMDIRLQISHVP
jgi:hypothetical protein